MIERLISDIKMCFFSYLTLAGSAPVGFIYTQLPGQGDPYELWGYGMHWSEVTKEYEGLFFRVLGGESAAFDAIQEENDHYLTMATCVHIPHHPTGSAIIRPDGSTSNPVRTGKIEFDKVTAYGMQFNLNGGEVRPRNRAVRLWKRIH